MLEAEYEVHQFRFHYDEALLELVRREARNIEAGIRYWYEKKGIVETRDSIIASFPSQSRDKLTQMFERRVLDIDIAPEEMQDRIEEGRAALARLRTLEAELAGVDSERKE